MQKRMLLMAVTGFLALGVALFGARANAQTDTQAGPGGEHMSGQAHHMGGPDAELNRLTKQLNLSDDQKNQIKPILEDRQQRMQSLRSDTSLSAEDRRSKMRSAMEDSNSKIRDVLNDDQKKKFDEMQQRRHEHMQGHTQGQGAATPQQ